MGTSHQLLSFYLRSWDSWQRKEYQRKANEIRARAKAENRYMTPGEEAQVIAYERASFRSILESVLVDRLRKLRLASKTGPLSKGKLKMVSLFARRGFPIAQEILEKQRQHMSNSPTKTG